MAGRHEERRRRRNWAQRVIWSLQEPAAINAAQVLGNAAAAAAGVMAMLGGFPVILNNQIGVLTVAVGAVLFIGGGVGALAVSIGAWWLERITLLIVALGWVLVTPATLAFAFSDRSTGGVWLVVALLATALSDIFKRYRRIDWAYLDPAR